MILPPRQQAVAVSIRDYRYWHGYSPTLDEIAEHLGVSKVTVYGHVTDLERKGVVTRSRHMARSLEVVRPDLLPPMVRNTKLRVLGTIG